MTALQLFFPTRILFGAGKIGEIGKLVTGRRVLIVCGRSSAQQYGYVEAVRARLHEYGIESLLYAGVSPNPRVREVNEAAKLARLHGADSVIGLGGGSALDAAKAIAVAMETGTPIEEYLYGKSADRRVPLILIPTTAGTGSETSKGAILTDEAMGVKTGVRGEALFPDAALVDPQLTVTLPPHLTAETGFDVFTHAVETYLSRKSQPFAEMLSMEALRRVGTYLPKAVAEGEDLEARNNLAYASTLMGINLGNSSTCLPHRLQYPVGAATDTSHPRGLVALYRAWLRHGYPFSPEKWNQIGQALAGKRCTSLDDVLQVYEEFLTRIGLHNVTLSSLGITADQVPFLADGVTGDLSADPMIQPGAELRVIEALFRESL